VVLPTLTTNVSNPTHSQITVCPPEVSVVSGLPSFAVTEAALTLTSIRVPFPVLLFVLSKNEGLVGRLSGLLPGKPSSDTLTEFVKIVGGGGGGGGIMRSPEDGGPLGPPGGPGITIGGGRPVLVCWLDEGGAGGCGLQYPLATSKPGVVPVVRVCM